MKLSQNNKNIGISLEDFPELNDLKIDTTKLHDRNLDRMLGSCNFLLFQRYTYFHWPAWLQNKINIKSKYYCPTAPLNLINDSLRDLIPFNNMLSTDEIYIDPAGMISTSYGKWSVEIWMIHGNKLFRPAAKLDTVNQKRNSENSVVSTLWEEKFFKINQSVYGARSTIDEAVVSIECSLKAKKSDSALILCVRPYNHEVLGGADSVSFDDVSNMISINGKKLVAVDKKPDFIISGVNEEEINIFDNENISESKSKAGMATLAVGFNLKQGANLIHYRIALDGKKELPVANYKLESIKEEFTNFVSMRLNNGARISMADKKIQDWFFSSKANSLHVLERDYFIENKLTDFRRAYFIVHGYNKMGYFKESEVVIEAMLKSFSLNQKQYSLKQTIEGAYLLCAIAEYFIHIRDINYLQAKYEYIKKIAQAINKISSKIKSINIGDTNTIKEFFFKEGHPFDFILIAHAHDRFSYLARCIGIFGDELKFSKEAKRLSDMFIEWVNSPEFSSHETFFVFYNSYSNYPFPIADLTKDVAGKIIEEIYDRYLKLPLDVCSYGWDVFNSLIVINNLISQNDKRGYEAIEKLMEIGENRFNFPEYLNPITHKGCLGKGSSKLSSILFFITIRNLMFIDKPERLELFPIPQNKWFKSGTEIVVENAPSRFGNINIKVVSTSNEIQIHFEELPKYVPPDIMINMPDKVKIIEGDDFIIKREEENSFVINGWPSLVRFQRK